MCDVEYVTLLSHMRVCVIVLSRDSIVDLLRLWECMEYVTLLSHIFNLFSHMCKCVSLLSHSYMRATHSHTCDYIIALIYIWLDSHAHTHICVTILSYLCMYEPIITRTLIYVWLHHRTHVYTTPLSHAHAHMCAYISTLIHVWMHCRTLSLSELYQIFVTISLPPYMDVLQAGEDT